MPRKNLTDLFVEKVKPAPKLTDFYDEKMRGLILSVNPGGRKAWRALYYVDGKPQTYTIGKYPIMSLKDARARALTFLADPLSEIAAAKAYKEADTFDEVADLYIKRHAEQKGLISKPEIARILKVHVRPEWGKRKFIDIKRSTVTHLLDKIEDSHSAAVADFVLSIVRPIMNWYARRYGGDDYTSPIIMGMTRTSAKERARKRVLADDELKALWQAADALGQPARTFGGIVKLCLLSAQRRTKVGELRWNDVDDAGVWTVDVQARQKGTGGTLALPEMAHAIIRDQPIIVGCEFVFPARRKRRGQPGIGPYAAWSEYKGELDGLMLDRLDQMAAERNDKAMAARYKEIRDLLAQANSKDEAKAKAARQQLKVKWWVLHDLRRTAKTLMARAGVLPHISERVLGHVIEGVEGIYDRFEYRDEKADALVRLASLIGTIINPPPANVVPLRPEAAA